MGESFEAVEAGDQLTRKTAFDTYAPAGRVMQAEKNDDDREKPTAPGLERTTAKTSPLLALRLNQNTGPLVGNGNFALFTEPDSSPDGRVAGLR